MASLITPQNPRIDLTHSGLRNAGAEFLWFPGPQLRNSLDYIRGEKGTVNGNPTMVKTAFMGRTAQFDGTDDAFEFSRAKRTTQSTIKGCTIAATFHVKTADNTSDSRRVLGTSTTTNAGAHMDINYASQIISFTKGGVILMASNITWDYNCLNFVIVSHNLITGDVNFLIKNLTTGKIRNESLNYETTPISDGDGIYNVGGSRVFNTSMFVGRCNFAMIGFKFMHLAQMREWGENPFGFIKFPQRLRLGKAVAGVASSATGRMTQMGYWGQA